MTGRRPGSAHDTAGGPRPVRRLRRVSLEARRPRVAGIRVTGPGCPGGGPGYVRHAPKAAADVHGYIQTVQRMFTAFLDMTATVEEVVGATVRYVTSGTHQAPFANIPATGPCRVGFGARAHAYPGTASSSRDGSNSTPSDSRSVDVRRCRSWFRRLVPAGWPVPRQRGRWRSRPRWPGRGRACRPARPGRWCRW
jgi:hypothetical protein